jgi:hypothetical protein
MHFERFNSFNIFLGRKLHWREEPQTLHRFPRHAHCHVRVDAFWWIHFLHRSVRHQLRGWSLGCASHSQRLHSVDRLGDAKCFAALHVGNDTTHLPEISNNLLGNDDQRTDEPRQVNRLHQTRAKYMKSLLPQVSAFHRERW